MTIADWLSTLNPLAVYSHYLLRKDFFDRVDFAQHEEVDPSWPTYLWSQVWLMPNLIKSASDPSMSPGMKVALGWEVAQWLAEQIAQARDIRAITHQAYRDWKSRRFKAAIDALERFAVA